MRHRQIFGNDMYYFSKQALIAAAGVAGMFIVSKIDYHYYGAFALEIYIFSMILMALVQTPLGVTVNGARRWIGLPGQYDAPAGGDHKDRGYPFHFL